MTFLFCFHPSALIPHPFCTMLRHSCLPRPNWRARVAEQGLSFADDYWNESACYEFSAADVDALETATRDLHWMCSSAVAWLLSPEGEEVLARFGIPAQFWPWLRESWATMQPALYGRFDLAFNGTGAPKLLEYNADTPTALLEAAAVQWFWFTDNQELGAFGAGALFQPNADQVTTVHEELIAAWTRLAPTLQGQTLYFCGLSGEEEDYATVGYLRDTAMQAGVQTAWLDMSRIGWSARQSAFVDERERPIAWAFKLYPWEWMLREQFGAHLVSASTRWIEPPWKMLLSHKGILPVLSALFPDSPYLLHADWSPLAGDYVSKPVLGREGANVEIVRQGQTQAHTDGDYAREARIYQEFCALPRFDERYAVIGSWVVGGQACGLGVREDNGPITTDASKFVPHFYNP